MGPPFEDGGGDARRATQEDENIASSMGPPFENGGGIARPLPGAAQPEASMGPPFENGGGQ